MSGVDEQDRVFDCPNCGETQYWVLRGYNEELERYTLIGYLNNPHKSDFPMLELMFHYKDWFPHAVLGNINKIYCDDCTYILHSYETGWKRVLDKIKELWEGRVFV